MEKTKADFSKWIGISFKKDTKNCNIYTFSTSPVYKQTGRHIVTFKIKFKAGNHYSIVRRKHFTVTEIFAFIGGLFGLFLGISVLSIAEIVVLFLHPLFKKMSAFFHSRKSSTNVQKANSLHEKAKNFICTYLRQSDIHGFKFIGKESMNFVERMFWVAIFVFSMTACVLMIMRLCQKLNFNSIVLEVDDQLVDASEIPFPAITIPALASWKLSRLWSNSLLKSLNPTSQDRKSSLELPKVETLLNYCEIYLLFWIFLPKASSRSPKSCCLLVTMHCEASQGSASSFWGSWQRQRFATKKAFRKFKFSNRFPSPHLALRATLNSFCFNSSAIENTSDTRKS